MNAGRGRGRAQVGRPHPRSCHRRRLWGPFVRGRMTRGAAERDPADGRVALRRSREFSNEHDQSNDWHNVRRQLSGADSNASNPCAVPARRDDSACNLASINLMASSAAPEATFDHANSSKARRRTSVPALAQEDRSVGPESYPDSKEIGPPNGGAGSASRASATAKPRCAADVERRHMGVRLR